MSADMAEAQRVTIRCRAHHPTNANRPGCAGHILDDDRLAECAAHPLGEDARQRI